MKYEFHVGDYVETQTGTIGYVSKVSKKELPYWTPTKLSDNDIREQLYSVGDSYCITFPLFPAHNDFNRIGQYDFTKKEESKIEPLVKSWILEGACSNGEYYFDSREVIDKINELVAAVNQLEGKVNET